MNLLRHNKSRLHVHNSAQNVSTYMRKESDWNAVKYQVIISQESKSALKYHLGR